MFKGFDPNYNKNDIRTVQAVLGVDADGIWGPKSQAAFDQFKKSYTPVEEPERMQFRWQGMTGGDAAQAYTAHDTRRLAEIEQQLARNEQKIQELKEEYARLQQEAKDSVGEMERKIAANRAGIGDSSQYNAWRSREDSRAAMENARQEDNKGKLSVLRSKVNNAMRELSYARGDKQEAVARQIYDDALAEYNKAAQAAGEPQMAPNTSVSGKTVTMFDTKDFIRQHRDSKGHWDSEENKQTAYEMAHSLGDEGVQLLDEIFGQKTQGKAASDAAAYKRKVEAELAKLDMKYLGDGDTASIEIDGQPVQVKIEVDTDGKGYHAVVNGRNYKLR
jgi:hypothetical protein